MLTLPYTYEAFSSSTGINAVGTQIYEIHLAKTERPDYNIGRQFSIHWEDKMKNKGNKGQVIFGWFIILSAGFFGYWIGQGNQQDSQPANDRELQKVIDRGTSSIQSLALAAKTESNNADILLQILNALNDKPVKELPEVRHPMYTLEFKLEDGDVDVPVTFEQVRKDQLVKFFIIFF